MNLPGTYSLVRTPLALLLTIVVALSLMSATPASANTETEPLPWPAPGSPPLPPDYTVPYLPAVDPVCAKGSISCFHELERLLRKEVDALKCDHDVIFSDSYLIITRALIDASKSGVFERTDRVNHEARQYAQEYFDQYARWHSGDRSQVSPSWAVAFQAAEDESVTALGNILLHLNAHIRRDNPIRAVEQSEGVLRVRGLMPAASGRPDHDRISDVLQDTLEPMLDRLAARYDPTIDDGADLFGMVVDQEGLYALISTWREESWRNGEQLRHARALGGVDGLLYRSKLAEIEASALAGAELIKVSTLTTPQQNEARNAYCAQHHDDPARGMLR